MNVNPKFNSLVSDHMRSGSAEEEDKVPCSTGDTPSCGKISFKQIVRIIKSSFEKTGTAP